MMKAFVWEGAWQMPMRELETPEPGPEDVVVAMKATGICGSDVHGFMGITGRRLPGFVMGHEFTGAITAVGDRVLDHKIGDRVVVCPVVSCGVCELCRAGKPNICVNRTISGVHHHGSYAEFVRVPQRLLHRLPDHVSWEHGALAEPLSVAMHGVSVTPINLMDTVVIVGAGTIGLFALVAARLRGAGQLIVTDTIPHRLELARQLGADVTVNVTEEDPVAVVHAHTSGLGADCAIEAVGVPAAVKQALEVVRLSGNVTWIGNSHPIVEVNMQQVVTREITIRGSYTFVQEFQRAIDAIAVGRVNVGPLIGKVAPLDDTLQIFQDMANGKLDAVKVVLKT